MKETMLYPAIVLPTTASLTPNIRLGTEYENVDDNVAHYSDPIIVQDLQEKKFQVDAIEWVIMAAPGNLQVWVEVATYNYMARFGGVVTPWVWAVLAAPAVIVPTGVMMTAHSVILPWTTHSFYARVGVLAPGAGAVDFWIVQASIEGKG